MRISPKSSLSFSGRAPNETPTSVELPANVPHGSIQQGCRCSLLWEQPCSLVAMGWRRRGSRRSVLHLLQPSTVPLDILLSAAFIAATPLSHPPGVYRARHDTQPCEAPAAWTRSASAYIALPAGAAYRLCTSSRINKTPSTHRRYHMPALCVLAICLDLS